MPPNGWRCASSGVLVGRTRQYHFAGINSKPRNLPENAATPTTMAPALFAGVRVHAVLGSFMHTALLVLEVVEHQDAIELSHQSDS